MEKYLLVGTILKPYGVKGQFRVYSHTSFPKRRFKKDSELYLFDGKEYKKVKITSAVQKEKMFFVLSLEGYDTVESVEQLRNFELCALKEDNILKKDEYFFTDLVGLNVFDENKNELGTVVKVEEFPAQITLKIQKKSAETYFFVPFNDFFVKTIDLENKQIIIHVIEGLID